MTKVTSGNLVVRASHEDVVEMLRWLAEESRNGEVVGGFIANASGITRSFDNKELWVIRRNGRAVAFQCGRLGLDICGVQTAFQRQGLGLALWKSALRRARRGRHVLIEIECAPAQSFNLFWARQGFTRCSSDPWGDSIRAERGVDVARRLDRRLPQRAVSIVFRSGDNEDRTLETRHEVLGATDPDGSILLARRAAWTKRRYHPDWDRHVEIHVDGVLWHRGCPSSPSAKAVGVWRDARGNGYGVDRLVPARR